MQQHQPAPTGAPTNVLSLAAARSSRQAGDLIGGRDVETQNCISTGLKTAHVRFFPLSKTAHGRKAAHVQDSNAQRVAPLHGRSLMAAVNDRLRALTGVEAAMAYETLTPEDQQSVSEQIRKAARRKSDDDWYRAFGARLRSTRLALGVSENDAAAAAGRSVVTWLNYERTGKGRLTIPVLKFARRYGISLDDIIRD